MYEQDEYIALASQLAAAVEQMQLALGSILIKTLGKKPVSWNEYLDYSKFTDSMPTKPIEKALLPQPNRDNEKYNPKLTLYERISKKGRLEYINLNDFVYQADYQKIQQENTAILESNAADNQKYQNSYNSWSSRKNEFYRNQSSYNTEIELYKSAYREGKADAIETFYENMLSSIKDPFEFERQVKASYQADAKLMLIDQYLPTVDNLPNLKKVVYVKSSGKLSETHHTSAYMNQVYEDVIYQIVLQTFYLVFMHDEKLNFIDSIVLNGRVNTIDKTTGSKIKPYILSVSIKKAHFDQLNLSAIDPKAWFKSSKGISAAKIAMVTPVAPIAMLDKEDSRFIDGYSVMNEMDNSINLASMDWQDFENLIRDLFGEEFNIDGGEVKITQASRDGGVDAVAFDPSPIRGGKIVIQAKRYTNVVGVSAVRDLYGTVLNEGAMKGILITTSNYGNDAYNFAQGKPLTLLNGANLLAMLEKHGHKARIDLREAKELQKAEKADY